MVEPIAGKAGYEMRELDEPFRQGLGLLLCGHCQELEAWV